MLLLFHVTVVTASHVHQSVCEKAGYTLTNKKIVLIYSEERMKSTNQGLDIKSLKHHKVF